MKRIWIYLLIPLILLVACERRDPQGGRQGGAIAQPTFAENPTVAAPIVEATVVQQPTVVPTVAATNTSTPVATPQEVWYISSSVPEGDCRYAIYGHPGSDALFECTLLVGTQFSMGTRNAYGQLDPVWAQQEEAEIELGENSQFGECKEEILEGGIVKGMVLITSSKYFWVHLVYPCRGPDH